MRHLTCHKAALTLAVMLSGLVLLIRDSAATGAESDASAARKQKDVAGVTYPPVLPDGKEVVTDTSEAFLKPPATLRKGVAIAKTAPTIDFLFYPGQTYAGKPWSNWGDSLAAGGKYYASIGDHLAPAGNAFVYEYDPATKKCRRLVDVRKLLDLPRGHYTPGKIHSRIDLGNDGRLYFATHRGSTRVTTDEYHYRGDWIIRCDPASGKAEVVAQGPVPKHCIPASVFDPKRLIFYGGTAPGTGKEGEGIQFFAYDVKAKKVLYAGPDGPSRYMFFARSTGRMYYVPGKDEGKLMRYDPESNGGPIKVEAKLGLRAATQETPHGYVYTVSSGQGRPDAPLWSFNTKTEKSENLGPAAVGNVGYIASLDVDPTGRYLYYIPGAHGDSGTDGSPIVQFDVNTRQKKVIAFLHPFYKEKYGCTLKGTYSSAVDPKGDKLYVVWNVSRSTGKAWDCCALTVIHIPESERQPSKEP
jgi:hypothetical protein